MLREQMAAIPAMRAMVAASGIADARIAAIPDMMEGFLKADMRFIRTAMLIGSPATRVITNCTGWKTTPLILQWLDVDKSCYDFLGAKLPLPINQNDDALYAGLIMEIIILNILSRSGIIGAGAYESGGVRLCEKDVVFDCGANMGFFSAVAAANGCDVYAFEPSSHIRKTYLEKTAALNTEKGRIAVFPYATSDSPGTIEFIVDHVNLGMSRMDNRNGGKAPQPGKNRETVETVRLDDFVERHGIARVDFIKADIEGAERKMLSGATNILKKFAPKLAICTYHLPDDPEVLESIVLKAQPKYIINHSEGKLFAYVP
jgi:FkbM family methyltransferase